MNKISIFVVVLICNELLAAPMENNLQGKIYYIIINYQTSKFWCYILIIFIFDHNFIERDHSEVANIFQMQNIGDSGRILVSDSQNLIQIRNKREYARGRRHGHHHQKIHSRKNSLKRKKLHAHTIDHMTRKHRQHRHGSRSD